MFPHDATPSSPAGTWQSCRTGGFSGLDSLLETSGSGFVSLQPAYYEALSACISNLEATQPSGSRPEQLGRAAPP
jgi:hypothetical protein